jgi:hypothetical protein
MTWENAKAGYDFTAKHSKTAYDGTVKFAGKMDHQLDEMGVDKKEVAKKTGTALWDATKAVGGALWLGSKAAYSAATTKDEKT